MDTMDDEQLHRLLADAEPPTPTHDLAVLASLADLNRRVAAQARDEAVTTTTESAAATPHTAHRPEQVPPRRGRRRAQRPTRIAVLALVATVATGTVAAAGFHAARTGLFGQAGMTENDTSQWLDPAGQDFPTIAAALAPAYVTYAPTTNAAEATDWVVTRNRGADARVQETGVARNYATYGQCSWLATWRHTELDSPAHAEAGAQLTASAAWPVFAATDGGGVVDSMKALARAAAAEDEAKVAELAPMECGEDLLTQLRPAGGSSTTSTTTGGAAAGAGGVVEQVQR